MRAILFDLDGTLLDTLEDLADSTNETLTRHGFPTHPVDAYRYFVGDGATRLIMRALTEEARTPDTVRRCLETYRHVYARRWNNKTRPYAGVTDMLDELKRRGIRLAVLSNKPHEFTVQCVSALLPRWTFDAVLGASERFAHKPDPASALHVAHELRVPPGEFLYLGDTGTDMKTAVAAGMYAVGALWGFRQRQELEAAGAKRLIAHPMELVELL